MITYVARTDVGRFDHEGLHQLQNYCFVYNIIYNSVPIYSVSIKLAIIL